MRIPFLNESQALAVQNSLSPANRARVLLAGASRATASFPGKTRLMHACDRGLRRLSANPDPVAVSVDDVCFLAQTTDTNDFKLMYGCGFEPAVIEFLVRTAGSRAVTIWDVGANVGVVSLLVAARCSSAHLVAIEASPRIARRLEANLACNPGLKPRVQTLHAALTAESGEARFYESAESFNGGVGRLDRAHNTVARPCSVSAWSGDDLIARGLAAPPDIVKLDVEGFEYPALCGLARHLRQVGCTVVFEHEPYRLSSSNNPPSPVAWLRELGYGLSMMLDSGHVVPLAADLPDHHCDLVASPVHGSHNAAS